MASTDKQYKKLVRRRRWIKFFGFLAGFLITLGGIAIVLNINPITEFQRLTGTNHNPAGKVNKISFNESTNTFTTPNGKYVLTSYDTATATVDVNDPNQLGHELILIFYSFTNTSSKEVRPYTDFEQYVKAYQGDNQLDEGMQLIETDGLNIDLENASVTDQKPGSVTDALAHFDFDPSVDQPVVLEFMNERGQTIHKITYDVNQ